MGVDLDNFGKQDIERFVTVISARQAADRSALAYRAVLRSLSYLLLEYDLGRAEQRLNMMSRRELKERGNVIFHLLPCILRWPDVVLRDSWKQSFVGLTKRGTLIFDARIPSFEINMRVSGKPKFLDVFYNKHGVPSVGFGFELLGGTGTEALLSNLLLDAELLEKVTASELLEFPLFNGDHARAVPSDLLGMLSTRSGWEFWDRWYRGFLQGEPLDWELQRRVALIPRETWEAGADAVAEAIAEIEAEYLREEAPLAERVEFNADSNRFHVVPIPMQNAAFMSALMSRTADALDDALHENNGLREDMREVRVLRRTHERYSNDPQRVEMDYTSVAISLRRNLDAKELADSEDNLALLKAVEDGVRGLRAHHPEVAANRETLAKQAMRELPADQIALLEDAQDVLPEITEGVMQEDFARDIPKLINDATLPLPSGAPPLPGADEATRIFSRSAGIKLLYATACESGAAIFDSKEFKTVRLGLTVSGLLSALITLGLTIFGVL